MREERKGGGRRRLAAVPWLSAFYHARRVEGGVGRSKGSRGHSDDREDGLGDKIHMDVGLANESRTMQSPHWRFLPDQWASQSTPNGVGPNQAPRRWAGFQDGRRSSATTNGQSCKVFHQNRLGSSVARGRCRPRAVRIRDKWINPDAPTLHKRRPFHGPPSKKVKLRSPNA